MSQKRKDLEADWRKHIEDLNVACPKCGSLNVHVRMDDGSFLGCTSCGASRCDGCGAILVGHGHPEWCPNCGTIVKSFGVLDDEEQMELWHHPMGPSR